MRPVHSRTLTAVLFFAAFVFAGTARAGALYVNEFNTPSQAAAGAGAEAAAEDASTAIHNPAGMTRLDSHQLQTGLGAGFGFVRFDADANSFSGGDGGNQSKPFPLLTGSYVHRLSERWRLGVGLYSFSGAALDPNNGWTGRVDLQKISFLTLNVGPAVAVRATDWLSLSVGPTVTYGLIDYDLAIPFTANGQVKVDNADDITASFRVGALIEPLPTTRIGVTYQYKTELDLDGDISVRPIGGGGVDANLGLDLVQFVRVGFYHELNERLTLLATGGWEDWSAFDRIPVSTANASVGVPTHWKDTWHASLGLAYRLGSDWTLRSGITYDSSPVKAKNRLASLPVDRQVRVAFGAEYNWSENVTVGGSFEWVDLGKGKIRNTNPVRAKGDYEDNDLFFFAFHVNWKRLPWDGRG